MIRPAARDDATRLAEVHITSWQHAYRGLFPDEFLERLDMDRRIQFFAERIGAGEIVLVSEADGEVVAFCWPAASSEPEWGEILSIYAHPDYWGKGHGHDLLEAGEEHLRAQRFQRALLWVLDANTRARAFYERQGWVLGGGLKLEEIGGTQVTEVRYEKEL